MRETELLVGRGDDADAQLAKIARFVGLNRKA
jgi:hypothetical protein